MKDEIKRRTKSIGVQIIQLIDYLPNKPSAWELSRQITRSSTSVGANYRAACRAKSTADYLYKLKIVEEEADETLYWIEVLVESKLLPSEITVSLQNELNEIISIIVATIKTLRNKK